METNNLFNPSFVDAVRNVLNERCTNGAAITRAELCRAVGLEVPESSSPARTAFENLVSALISLNVLSGYEVRSGRLGGIARAGDARPKAEKGKGKKEKKTKGTTPAQVAIPEGFLETVREKLNEMTANGSSVSRRELAAAIEKPGSNTENLISRIFKAGQLPEYTTKLGPNGGFTRAEIKTETTEAAE